jgi:lactate dehydrogenase-like 2-hydroxyacid dehydrogenase
MVEALKSGQLASVGLDGLFRPLRGPQLTGCTVFENEPQVHPYLLDCDVAVLAPHAGGLTEVSRLCRSSTRLTVQGTIGGMEAELCDNIESYLESGKPVHAVNEAGAR